MCGIFGYFSSDFSQISSEIVKSMGDVINYRGPDGQGIYYGNGLALGNQRLAIIDLQNGNQPFISEDNSIVVVQNGEIFNHIELAKELEDSDFYCRTHSDTEVILRLYQKHGIGFIHKLNGMFSIAIYDKNLDKLFLIRDRVGEKPLYFYNKNNTLLFSSEIKSILNNNIEKDVNINALDSYLTFNYVTPPLTLFKDIYHVMPGTYLDITRNNISEHTWWSIENNTELNKTEDEWITEFNGILDDAVRIRLRSDVPFGAFLSGGVDSSTIVGYMSQHLQIPVKTFSIGFQDPKYDESIFAQEAADRFHTDHYSEKVEANLLSLWNKAIYHCDQPHGDVSFMPTLRVAELASKKVKMVLTGDGADELFAGYDKYKEFISSNSDTVSDDVFFSEYYSKISLFREEDREKLYTKALNKIISKNKTKEIFNNVLSKVENLDRINRMLFIDTYLLLSGNNLVKPDRMGMAVSIENRAPFLDYRMIEYAFSMPGELKLHKNETKYIYKKAVKDLIGSNLAYRKKQMFTVPIGEWLKSDLKPLVNELLFSKTTENRNLFNYSHIKDMYDKHCSNEKNYTREIRALMALEIWFREFIPEYTHV